MTGEIDPRPLNCRFCLQEEGKAYPRSSCKACGRGIADGLGRECADHPRTSASTVVVGSAADKDAKRERLRARLDQALDEISDEGVFSPDQITTLRNAFIILRWGIEETI